MATKGKKVVTDDHRIAREYVVESFKENGFAIGPPSWHGNGYWLPVTGHGISHTVNMKFTTEGGKILIDNQEIFIADPDKDKIINAIIMSLFNPKIGRISGIIHQRLSKLMTNLRTSVPYISIEEPSLDKIRFQLLQQIDDNIEYLKRTRGTIFEDTKMTYLFIELYKMRDSNVPWTEKLKFISGLKPGDDHEN